MKIEGRLEVKLRKDYQSPVDWTPQKTLPAGTIIDVFWVSEKAALRGENQHKEHVIQFCSIDKHPHWVNVTWDDVEHPKNCALSYRTSYAQGQPMVTVYCATRDDFVGVESKRTDIDHCPLCGKSL